jgi:predicted CXXCH cytochrome family protein
MIRKLAGFAVVASLLFAGAAFAQTGNMAGTGHDFSDGAGFDSDNWNASNGFRTCNVCHTTHTGVMGISGVPLWDHEITSSSFAVYTGVNMNQTPTQPSGATQLCLSCHDGTLGLDSFGGNRNTTDKFLTSASSAFIGLNLQDDHPVSVAYNGATAGLHAGGSQNAAVQLFSGIVECASCHEPHNSANQASLLVVDPSGSALCEACHNK